MARSLSIGVGPQVESPFLGSLIRGAAVLLLRHFEAEVQHILRTPAEPDAMEHGWAYVRECVRV